MGTPPFPNGEGPDFVTDRDLFDGLDTFSNWSESGACAVICTVPDWISYRPLLVRPTDTTAVPAPTSTRWRRTNLRTW